MPKIFYMVRKFDESHISGTGNVLSGVIFDSGQVVVQWHSQTNVNSLGVYKNYYDFYFIHCKSHPTNDTEMVFERNYGVGVATPNHKCNFCGNAFSEHPKDVKESRYIRICSGDLVRLCDD